MTDITVGFVQNKPQWGKKQDNCRRVQNLAKDLSAQLIVLPELFATGYYFDTKDKAQKLAENIPDGPTTRFLAELAKEKQSHLIAGVLEQSGGRLYNSAVVVGPSGYIAHYRKTHLFDTEKNIFTPGDSLLEPIDLGFAKVGVLICFDWRFPEVARTLSLKGAEILAHPSNLVLPNCPQAMITRCLENRVFAITADRVGTETEARGNSLSFIGQSQIVDPDGNVLHRASTTEEAAFTVKIDIAKARNKKINPNNDLFQDHRPTLYSS